jgi:hypothetical protein
MRWRIDSKCLSLSKIQAEMSSARRPSAFSFETFATSTFDVVMAEEGIGHAEAAAITHAATQVRSAAFGHRRGRCSVLAHGACARRRREWLSVSACPLPVLVPWGWGC